MASGTDRVTRSQGHAEMKRNDPDMGSQLGSEIRDNRSLLDGSMSTTTIGVTPSVTTGITLPASMKDWGVEHVQQWMKNIGLGLYTEIIIREAIQGRELLVLSLDQMKDIGIAALGHRIRMDSERKKWEDDTLIQKYTQLTLEPSTNIADNTPIKSVGENSTIALSNSNNITSDSFVKHSDQTESDTNDESDTEEVQIVKKSKKSSKTKISTTNKRPHKKVFPTFKGDKEDIAAYKLFKQGLERYLEYCSVPENETYIILGDAMQGKAALWLAGYTSNHPEITTYNFTQLMSILDKEYLNPLATSRYQYEYESMTAKYNESISELVTRIDNLATQAERTNRTVKEKKIKLHRLLPEYIQSLVMADLHGNATFEEFVTIVGHIKDHKDNIYQKKQKNMNLYNNRIVSSSSSITHNNQTSNNRMGSKYNKEKCKWCDRDNHPTFLCNSLLQGLHLNRADAVAFWEKNKLQEQLQQYNNRTNNTNTNAKTQSSVQSEVKERESKQLPTSTSNVNDNNNNKTLVYVDGQLDCHSVRDMLVDEGSMLSIISAIIYIELMMKYGRQLNHKLSINDLPVLYQADGVTPLKVTGRLLLQLRFENTIIGTFPFLIVESALHNVIIGRDITRAANLSVINDNGTQIVQGLDTVNSNIRFNDTVNIFQANNIIAKNTKQLVTNINISSNIQSNTKVTLQTVDQREELPEHMRGIVIGDLPKPYTAQIKSLLIEYQDIFHKPGDPINALNTHIKHHIRLVEGAKPIKSRIYPLPLTHHKAIKEQVNNWLQLGIVKPSFSPWSTPCLVINKKDVVLGRVCGAFRGLNEYTVNDAYPIREIEEQKSHFVGSVICSQIDLKDAYLQVELDEESKEKTAIVTQEGLFEFTRMIQGLKTAPATFHRIIDDAFKDLISGCLEPYFDDLTVHSKTDEDHLTHLRQVFNIMRKYGFKAKASKVKIGVRELQWLGFIISNGTIRPDNRLVSAIVDLTVPTNLHELRMVTGLFNFYRSFIPKFADLAAPLDELKKQVNKYAWTEKQQTSFNLLKDALTSYPVLRLPDMNRSFTLDTDASTIGIGGILQQNDTTSNTLYVVSYFSRKLSEAERKWSVTDLEALAMRDSIRKFSRYLIGRSFVVRVDHISLTYLKTLKTLTGKLGRISLDLQAYDYTILYKPGREHVHVDCLSRMPNIAKESDEVNLINNINEKTEADLSAFYQIQQADTFTVDLITYIEEKKCADLEQQLQFDIYLNSNKQLTFKVEGKILKVRDKRVKDDIYQIIIPDKDTHMQLQLTQLLHNPIHQGIDTLYKTMRQKFYWTNMKKYLTDYVNSCLICQRTKRSYHDDKIEKNIIISQSIDDPLAMCEPLSQITIDHLDLPLAHSGYKCLLVIVDRATRLVKAIPSKTHETQEVIDNLIEHWIFTYGVPRVILSDRGSAFVSKLMKQLNKMLGIDHVLSTPYNPKSHGLVERANQTIQKIMRGLLTAHHDGEKNWDKYINHVIFVMNTTINQSTGYTPYELIYGRKACYPIDRLLNDDEIFSSIDHYLQDLLQKQKVNYAIVHEALLSQQEKNELYNNENTSKIRTYDIGDMVYKKKYKSKKKNKLTPLYEGPYVIIKKINDLCYQIKLADNDLAPSLLVNIRYLKPFIEESPVIKDAKMARKTIDQIMQEFDSIVQYHRPISKDDYMTDADLDLLLSNE
jgi:transposase InsO family protein